VTHKQSPLRGTVASDHIVQLFDTQESLADAVSGFLCEGYEQESHLLVVATTAHWDATARELERRGCDVRQAAALERLTVKDAADVMALFMRNGLPDPQLFHDTLGVLVGRLVAESPVGLRIYGEMVDLLAAEGNFTGAQQLEELWNDLGLNHPFTLFCGYSSVCFGNARDASALAAICRAHTHVRRGIADTLGSWLVSTEPPAAYSTS
jgi:hypothetical protein